MKTRAGIAPLLRSVNDPTTLCFSDKEKASILQKQFCSVFVNEPDGDVPTIDSRTAVLMPEVSIMQDEVRNEIKSINKNKSCGPDEIEIRMLHELLDTMCGPITEILKKSFNLRVFHVTG